MLGKRRINVQCVLDPNSKEVSGIDLPAPARKRSKLVINASRTQSTNEQANSSNGGCLTPRDSPSHLTFPVKSKANSCQIGDYTLLSPVDNAGYSSHALHFPSNQIRVCQRMTTEQYKHLMLVCERIERSEEREMLKKMLVGDNLHIVQQARDFYVFSSATYGCLHTYVQSCGRLDEAHARPLYSQIATLVSLCHSVNIVVRDLKLRKFVFDDCKKTSVRLSSICDLVVCPLDSDILQSRLGSPAYVSPEILDIKQTGYSGKAADMWSIGVLLFVMLLGRYPFYHNTPSGLFGKIKTAAFSIPTDSGLSMEVRYLLRGLLRRVADERPSAAELVELSWMQERRRVSAFGPAPDDQVVPCL